MSAIASIQQLNFMKTATCSLRLSKVMEKEWDGDETVDKGMQDRDFGKWDAGRGSVRVTQELLITMYAGPQ